MAGFAVGAGKGGAGHIAGAEGMTAAEVAARFNRVRVKAVKPVCETLAVLGQF